VGEGGEGTQRGEGGKKKETMMELHILLNFYTIEATAGSGLSAAS